MSVTRKLQLRRGTAAAWTSANPILSAGEVGFETDTKKTKTGDGTTAWTSLVYNPSGTGTVTGTNTGDQTLPTRVSLGLNTSDTVTFANLSGSNTGDESAKTIRSKTKGYISNPATQNQIYVPLFTALGVADASNVSIHASGGIVATTAGVSGTCDLYMPAPIDPTQPFRCAILMEINDSNDLTVSVQNAAGDAATGAYITVSSAKMSAFYAGYQVFLNQYGFTGGIPAGTKLWWVITSDGTNVQTCLIPDVMTAFNSDTKPAYQVAYTATGYTYSEAITKTYSGYPVYGDNTTYAAKRLGRIAITTASTGNRVIGCYFTQGLAPPQDGLLSPPIYYRSTIYGDSTAWLLGKSQSYQDLVLYFQPNNSSTQYAMSTSTATIAAEIFKLYDGGYMLFGIMGTPSGSGYAHATASNWGAPAGHVYKRKWLDYIRANIPNTGRLHALGTSMGLVNALTFHKQYPTQLSSIIGISGVTDLADSYTNYAFGTTIQKAYSTFYVCIQAGTGQTPASSPTYWTPISQGMGHPSDTYYNSATYTWRDTYAAGTAYSVNDVVAVSNSGTVLKYNFNSPILNPYCYRQIPIKLWHGTSDTTIPPTQATGFQTAVNAIGGNVSVVSVTSGTHLGNSVFDGTTMLAFLNSV